MEHGEAERGADRQLIEEYGGSGLTRREFCERHHVPITTLDYWRRFKHANHGW